MKRNSTLKSYTTLKAGKGFKKTGSSLKRSGFRRSPTLIQSEVIKADSKFARNIKERDGRCMRCGTTMFLTCSHYHGRAIWSTRYSELNCVTFCTECHNYMESKKKGEYKEFMMDWLGLELFNTLNEISKIKVTKEQALLNISSDPIMTNQEIQY